MEPAITQSVITVGIEQLSLSSARPDGYVPQPTPALQQRIVKHGVLEPIAVRRLADQRYEILTHPTSWVAAGRAGIFEVPVMVHEDVTDAEAADIVADHYLTGIVDPIEEAAGFQARLKTLRRGGRRGTVTELARRLGLPRTQVAHALRLLELPSQIQTLIRQGKLSPGQARPLITVRDERRQWQLAKRISAERLSARHAERLAREQRRPGSFGVDQSSTAAEQGDADVRRLEQQVTELIGSPFEIRGKEAVFNFFGNYEVLDGILNRLGYRNRG